MLMNILSIATRMMLNPLKKKHFKKVNNLFLVITCLILSYYLGAFTYPFTMDYDSSFNYPLQRNIVDCAIALSKKEIPECIVINKYDYKFIVNNEKTCIDSKEGVRLLLIIKSAIRNHERREAIRRSWGHEERFSDVVIKRIFILGLDDRNVSLDDIKNESQEYGDIATANFLDTYYNNTIKTMMGFKWAVDYCPSSKFYLFSDDDMYISVKNVLRFIRNPTEYPHYLEKSDHEVVSQFINKGLHYELPKNVKLFAGFVIVSSPHRHRCSKWFVSLEDYPYNKWPPYISAGSYILSQDALKMMFYASFFTKHFRFDDVYLGLLAKKMNIEPFHCSEFNIFQKIRGTTAFKYILSSHGYFPEELVRIWSQQKSLGNA